MQYRISDLAKILNVTSMTIRRYENDGYISPERDDSDYRWYTQKDILKIGQIRLLRKCNFTHEQIREIDESNLSEMQNIAKEQLNKIDQEINRLKFLRHWLKDNIQLMTTVKELDDKFMTMMCPSINYIIYMEGTKLLKEPKRLHTIAQYIDQIEEVQHIIILKKSDLDNNILSPNMGWTIKEQDIERLSLKDIIENNPYIQSLPSQLCVYGSLSIPCNDFKNGNIDPYIKKYGRRLSEYLDKHSFKIVGDTYIYSVNSLGTTNDMLISTPIEQY